MGREQLRPQGHGRAGYRGWRAQIALAWVLRQDGVIAIPRASTPARIEQNRAALDLHLSDETLAELDLAFPPPAEAVPLEVL